MTVLAPPQLARSPETIPVTFYKNCRDTKPTKLGTLQDLFDAINSGKGYNPSLREQSDSNKEQYQKSKSKLPGFSIGKFSSRNDSKCVTYSGLMGFDIDKISSSELMYKLLEEVKKIDFIYAAFPSVSGLGLRLLVYTAATAESHKSFYKHIVLLLKKSLGDGQQFHIDSSTSNISRLWYYSALKNEELYINVSSRIIKTIPVPTKKTTAGFTHNGLKSKNQNTTEKKQSLTEAQKFELVSKIVEQRNVSGRNNYVMNITRLASENGISKDYIISNLMALEEDGFTSKEITRTVNYNYNNVNSNYEDLQLLKYANETIGHDIARRITTTLSDSKPVHPEPKTEEEKHKNQFVQIRDYLDTNYDLRRNVISLDIECKSKDKPFYDSLNESDLACELMENNFKSVERVLKMILNSSKISSYNPLKFYLDNLPKWTPEKPDYISMLSNYVVAKQQDLFNHHFKKMLVRSLACSLRHIPFNKQCFTIIGNQNDGKTSFLRFLIPKTLREYYKENLSLDKDGLIALAQNIFINLDEIATIPYKDRNKIKTLLTAEHIKVRLPYAAKETKSPRLANFLASTNDKELLTDDTGNVRWLVFEILGIKHDNGGAKGYNKNIDIDNVYAQAYYLLQNGFKYMLTSDEITVSERNNKEYVKTFTELEIMKDLYSYDSEKIAANFITTTEILTTLADTYPKINFRTTMIGKALNHMGIPKESGYSRRKRHSIKGYYLKVSLLPRDI